LIIHNDVALSGASSFKALKMAFNEHVISTVGFIDGASTHIMLRVNLKLEVPIMHTGTPDPTVTETRIPWIIYDFPDDRQLGGRQAGRCGDLRRGERGGLILKANTRGGHEAAGVWLKPHGVTRKPWRLRARLRRDLSPRRRRIRRARRHVG
jgi:hypothetical protein